MPPRDDGADPALPRAGDCFIRDLEHRVAICRKCHFAVFPDHLRAHLRAGHPGLSPHERAQICRDLTTSWPDLCLSGDGDFALPPPGGTPVPGLRVFHDGLQCTLDPTRCAYVCRSPATILRHWRTVHDWGPAAGRRGRQAVAGAGPTVAERRASACRPVCCQRLFRHGPHAGHFAVTLEPSPGGSPPAGTPPAAPVASLADAVLRDLAVLEQEQRRGQQVVPEAASTREVSPWLQMTRWAVYLRGCDLPATAALIAQPDPVLEPALGVLCAGLDRAVEDAYRSVCSDRINVFDQTRINSFLPRPRMTDRPLVVQLQKATWRQYVRIWKALLCFTYRTQQPRPPVSLRHRLTARQLDSLEQAVEEADRLVQLRADVRPGGDGRAAGAREPSTAAVDRRCLDLCIALLDHDLKGDLFESVVVGFLAVLGIDLAKGNLKEAYHYTPSLSGFIKIAQMLVIQKAVVAAEDAAGPLVSDLLDEMRGRFLTHGTRSPFSWANRLRMYGKKVRDSTTCLGFISWSEDDQSLSYRGIRHLTIKAFKSFARDQVAKAQAELEGLLLLHPEEGRDELGIEFWMHRVVDNAAENARDWNFLQHPQNRQGALPCRENWLLERVLGQDWLRDEFIHSQGPKKQVRWRRGAIDAYKQRINRFLERLLLLVHITSGQPGRGTEVLSLRYVNTIHGHHRNIFIDGGMVSTVTTYHKGYSVTGSTKIIHRYLPKEVGELLVYYLWLVHPFYRKLELLALRRQTPPSPYLWTKNESLEPWDSARLSLVLQRETKQAFGVAFTIPIYRHLAIAVSRKHLECGGFKRDYGLEDTRFNTQASHTTRTAGAIYARGFDEAPGQIEVRRAEYRKVSQEWHRFLGFTPASLPSRKRPLGGVADDDASPPTKRARPTPRAVPDQAEQDDVWEF